MLILPFALLRAEATTSTTSKMWRGQEFKARMEQRAENRQEKMETRREEMRVRFDARRGEVVTNILNRIETRFQNAIDRMGSVAVRIQERITLLEDDGNILDEAQEYLDAAEETLGDAQDALDDIDLDEAVSSSTPSTALAGVREEFRAVKELLKSARAQLSDAINSIAKSMSDSDDDN